MTVSASTTTEAGPSPLALLVAPDRAMDRQARVGRARRFFLFAWLCSLLLGAALAYRVDARSSTLRKLEKSGQLQTMSDRQVADETHNAERVAKVVSVAKGVVGVPLQLGSACVALLALTWVLRGRVKGSAVVPVAAATLLPGAIANLLDAVSARHAQTVILDVTGVPTMGVEVARALMKVVPAVRLLGADVVLTGLQPGLARTLIDLDIDMRQVVTRANLQEGLEHAAQLKLQR